MAQTTVRRMFGFKSRSAVQVDKLPVELSEKTEAIPAVPPPPARDSSDTSSDAAEVAPSPPAAPAGNGRDGHADVAKSEYGRRRFTWFSLSTKTTNGNSKSAPPAAQDTQPSVPAVQEPEKVSEKKQPKASRDRASVLSRTRSEKRARESALLLRELIVGPSSSASPQLKVKALSGTRVEKVRAQLADPKVANQVIGQLRDLPASDEPVVAGAGTDAALTVLSKGPIHAVCLPYLDAEAHERHFAQLVQEAQGAAPAGRVLHVHLDVASVANASVSQLRTVFSEMNIVSLITAPDLGLGQPGDGPGILSGALPTPETIINGVKQVTPQLLALGYATGKAILPNHAGVYPPTDRISVLTYWWGLEVVLPPPSLTYLENVPSIAHAVINFLSALALVEGGVGEILPFIRYISQFVDTEFSMIKQQNRGKGVVCAATWLVPAALVPRPWDFPEPPPAKPAPPAEAPSAGDDASGAAHAASPTEAPAAGGDTPDAAPAPPTSSTPAPAPAPESGSGPTPAPAPSARPVLPLLSLPTTDAPIVAAPDTAEHVEKTEVPAPDPPQDVPKMEITPATPPPSSTLQSATEGAFGEGGPAMAAANDAPAPAA